jgi:hypothetical protein
MSALQTSASGPSPLGGAGGVTRVAATPDTAKAAKSATPSVQRPLDLSAAPQSGRLTPRGSLLDLSV